MQRRDADTPTKQVPPRMVSLVEEKSDSLKRSHSDDNDDGPEAKHFREDPALSTAEKKRLREKRRRDEINKGFDHLMSLILEIDPELRAEAASWAKTSSSCILGGKEENLLTRGDLMNHTSRLLRRLHAENEEHKRTIAGLRSLSERSMGPIGLTRTVSMGPTRTASIQRHPSGASVPSAERTLNQQRMHALVGNHKTENQQQYLSEILRQRQQENEALFAHLAASRFHLDC